MIDITRSEAIMLRKAGRGHDVHMSSRQHKSRSKTYFLTNSTKSMKLLNEYRKVHTLEVHDGR